MCDCVDCEKMLQPYLDRVLDEDDRIEAEEHLARCEYCARAYRFEESVRRLVKRAAVEPMPLELKRKLAALRTPL